MNGVDVGGGVTGEIVTDCVTGYCVLSFLLRCVFSLLIW